MHPPTGACDVVSGKGACGQEVWEAVHLTVQHRHSVRTGQADLAAKQATARLRLLAHLPSDRAFFEAGMVPLASLHPLFMCPA